MTRPRQCVVLLVLLGAVVLAPPALAQDPRVLEVPGDHPTIQAAVDAAAPGDVVLVGEGTWHEEVVVPAEHPGGITIRGSTRNGTVLDGRDELATAVEVRADDVVVQNLTAHSYTGGGFWWQSVDGFRGEWLTAYRIGIYAIFAFDSVNGILADSYASGSADAGFYVGQCFPCNIVLRQVTAEHSALGYEGTNAGGNLLIEDSTFRHNGAGVMPNSLSGEANPPQRQATIRGNVIEANNNEVAPAAGMAGLIVGVGVVINGGNENLVADNDIRDHDLFGIAITPLSESGNVWVPRDNVVRSNAVSSSGIADLVVTASAGPGNCFEGNVFDTSLPADIEDVHGCADPADGGSQQALDELRERNGPNRDRPRLSWFETPVPPAQPEMPGGPFTAANVLPDESEGSWLPLLAVMGLFAVVAVVGVGLVLAKRDT